MKIQTAFIIQGLYNTGSGFLTLYIGSRDQYRQPLKEKGEIISHGESKESKETG